MKKEVVESLKGQKDKKDHESKVVSKKDEHEKNEKKDFEARREELKKRR